MYPSPLHHPGFFVPTLEGDSRSKPAVRGSFFLGARGAGAPLALWAAAAPLESQLARMEVDFSG